MQFVGHVTDNVRGYMTGDVIDYMYGILLRMAKACGLRFRVFSTG